MQVKQLEEHTMVSKRVLTYIIELLIERTKYVDYIDMGKSDMKEFVFRPFYLADDKLLILNFLSAVFLKEHQNSMEVITRLESEVEDFHKVAANKFLSLINIERLKFLLDKAELENISVFSVFFEWIKSSLFFMDKDVSQNEEILIKVYEDIMSTYSD